MYTPGRMQSDDIAADVRALALPAVLHNLLFTGVYLVDAVMVGHLGAEALAAVAIGGPVTWGVRSLFSGLSRGTLALVARAVGAGDRPLAEKLAQESLAIALILACATTPLALATGAIYRFFGVEPGVASVGAAYLAILFAGLPLTILAQVLTVIFQAAGDTRTPMLAGIVSNVVHVFANGALMYGWCGLPRMGAPGAAAGTLVAHGLMGGLLVLAPLRDRAWIPRAAAPLAAAKPPLADAAKLPFAEAAAPRVPIALEPLDTRAARFAALVRIGTPALGEAVAYQSAYLVFSRLVAGLGTQALAAHRIAISVESIAFMPADGLQIAAATLTGQSLGAGRPARARAAISTSLRLALRWMAPLSLGFLAFARPIAAAFTSDPALLATTTTLIRLAAVEIPFLAATNVQVGGLAGAGDTRSAFAVTAAGAWMLRLPATWLLGHALGFGVAGVWVATSLDWALRSVLAHRRIARARWAVT